MKIIIFGAGYIGRRYYCDVKKWNGGGVDIVAFADNNFDVMGTNIESIPVISPMEIVRYDFDKIVVTVEENDHLVQIISQLIALDIKEEMIDKSSRYKYLSELSVEDEAGARVSWLRAFATHVHMEKITGNVCECGVFRGDFAAYINKYFYDKKLYLFDTFTGFTEESMALERSYNNKNFINGGFWKSDTLDFYKKTNTTIVMNKMLYPQNCIIKQGMFPETAADVSDTFCFVNLDMDLYAPTLAALHFFWDKIVCGGVILLHDYYAKILPGVSQAVADFEGSLQTFIPKIPIGDNSSMALIKGRQ